VSVEPAVYGLEGNTEVLGELDLGKTVFEAVSVEASDQVGGHQYRQYIT
jgi:hypothetical protein